MISKMIETFLQFQKKYALPLVILGILAAGFSAPKAVKLLSSIKTDLINLLPDDYPAVVFNRLIKKKFNRRSSMYLIIHSPDKEANLKAMEASKAFLLKELAEIDYIETEKRGFDFFDKNKLLLMDLKDLYKVRDKLKDKIQKKKLGGLYIDFEEDESSSKDGEGSFESFVEKYQKEFAEGVRSPYKTNKTGTVYVLNIYPKSTDSGLKFFKTFGELIQNKAKEFDFKAYHPEMSVGYAGAIITRVDQYKALMDDLKQAGIISGLSIFGLLYLYFGLYVKRGKGVQFVFSFVYQLVPVIAVFLPMLISTLVAFWFCAFFFDGLNVVTSFLFAIIFGLGVDIGIHLITRFFQDRRAHVPIDEIHRNVVKKTGVSCAIGIFTTVASFYILTINDFRGFSEFGWIAGNGLVIALISYLLFFPPLLLLIDRWSLFPVREVHPEKIESKQKWIPFAKPLLATLVFLSVISLVDLQGLSFEWDFSRLQLKLPHREVQKDLLQETNGRVNSPAAYLVANEVEARKLRQVIRERQENDAEGTTVQFYRSYYDMIPFDQEEKMALLKEIKAMLDDDALNVVKEDQKKLLGEMKEAISQTKLLTEKDIPNEVHEVFWGNTGDLSSSLAYVMPLPDLQLGNGTIAKEFYEDVHQISTLGKDFYALSDSIVFAEVLQTLFNDSRQAIVLALVVIMLMIGIHFRNLKLTGFVFLGLGCGLIWMLGLMAALHLKLNFYNMIIIPAMIGMGVDNSVHVVHRFIEEGRDNMIHTLRTSGGAALMASLTTMFGYGGLCFTRHPGLESIGMMALVGMGTCLIGSLVLMPLLLQIFYRSDSAE